MFEFSTEETYKDGQIIYNEGNAANWIYVVESGSVELSKIRGEEKIVIDILKPGDLFGEVSFLAETPRTVTAQASGTTLLGGIDRTMLDRECSKLSTNFRMILKSIALRLEKATEKGIQGKLRRDNPRLAKVIPLKFETKEGFKEAFSGDMSVSGLFIKTPKPLSKGERFVLELQLPEASNVFTTDCIVSWTRADTSDPVKRPQGMGVKFVDVTEEKRRMLKEELMKAVSDSIFQTF